MAACQAQHAVIGALATDLRVALRCGESRLECQQNQTASGMNALFSNTTGADNTGSGYEALDSNTTGNANTASGFQALFSNSSGIQSSAVGSGALYSNTTGNNNLAFGFQALYSNATGSYNTAVGTYALSSATGSDNNAQGYSALFYTTTGDADIAQGFQALYNNTTGSHNIGIGNQAGYYQTTGNYNIYIGNYGVAAESGVIRIGDPNAQTAAFLAGVSRTNVTGGVNVVVNSSGQLGVVSSSRRYKEDIQPLSNTSERVYGLRPVMFRYIEPDEHGQKPVQYGLIAEEVAATFPELVVYNDKGQPETVQYQELTPILLNEVQQQQHKMAAQEEKLAAQAQQVREMQRQLAELKDLVAVLQHRAQDSRVAIR